MHFAKLRYLSGESAYQKILETFTQKTVTQEAENVSSNAIFTISRLIYTQILFIIRTITFRRNNHMDNNPNGNRPDNNKGPGKQDPNKNHQSILAFLVCLLITLVCFAMFTNMLKDNSSEITYDEFIEMVEDGDVKEVTLQSETLTITPKHQSSGFSEDVYYANQM